MKLINVRLSQEKIPYSEELEKILNTKATIDKLEKEFNAFLHKKGKSILIKKELNTLRLIKLFIHREQDKIRTITSRSILSGFDCMTLSIITCLLAKRKGCDVKIGRPDKVSRYFHSLIIKQNGEIFKIAGKNRNYHIKEIEIDNVIARLKTLKPIIDIVDSVKNILKKIRNAEQEYISK